MKFQYWLHYSTLDFSAFVIKVPIEITESQLMYDFERDFYGPFKTVSEAKKHGLALIDNDIAAFKDIKAQIKEKFRVYKKE